MFREAGSKPKLLVANKTMLRVLGLFNPLMREIVEMHFFSKRRSSWTIPRCTDC